MLSDRIVPLWALVSLVPGLPVPSHQGWRPRVQRRAPNRSDSDLGQVGASSGDLYYQMCEDDFEYEGAVAATCEQASGGSGGAKAQV